MIFTDQKVIYVCDRKACNGACPNPDSCVLNYWMNKALEVMKNE